MSLKEIAERAGVSVSTVSRVLSDKDTKAASKEVKERIWNLVRETGYVPDSNAQRLRRRGESSKKQTNNKYYACVYARNQDNKDMFFSQLAASIEYEAYKSDYILKYSFFANDVDDESFASAVNSKEISGIVILGRFGQDRIDAIANTKKNVVYVGLNFSTDSHDVVYCDGLKASHMAMNELYELGHREIAYLGEIRKESRYKGYIEFINCHDVKVSKDLVVDTTQTLEGGYRGACELLRRNADFSAIFCANDETAMGTIKGLWDKGVKVPEDVSVISIDDVEMASYFTPMLTTVHIPIDELGRHTAKTLIDRIEKGHTLPVKIELPFTLSRRDSCAPKTRGSGTVPKNKGGKEEKQK